MNILKMLGLIAMCSLVCLGCNGSADNDYDCVVDSECEGTQVCRNGKCVLPEQLCGNGHIDPNETCDSNCPTSCSSDNACIEATLVGSAENCDARCDFVLISACADGDGCCPDGCDRAADDDCPDLNLCGNDVLDPGETCDGDCPESCDDSDDCSIDILTGSAKDCTADCFYAPVTSCTDGDGCCPTGCDASNDNDCNDDGFALRLNAGLETGTSTFDGKVFEPLRQYVTAGGANSSSAGLEIPINGTVFDELYQVEFYIPVAASHATFSIPVEDGDYTVHLHFVDWTPYTSEIGDRVFHVDIQGERVLSDFDMIAEAGKNTAIVKSFDVSVTTGSVEVTITNSVFVAEIAAVEILRPGQPYLGEGVEEPPCGDGIVANGLEACDDGNTVAGDGCSAFCGVEPGWVCTGEPSECSKPPCGDGVVADGLEACDDGGTDDGDGCSATCQIESGWRCTGEPSQCEPINYVDLIVSDMGNSEVRTVMTHGSMIQAYMGQWRDDVFTRELPGFNVWNEIELQGDPDTAFPNSGGGCLKAYHEDTRSLNTRVEFGKYRGWYLDKHDQWHLFSERIGTQGVMNPRAGSVFGSRRQCMQDYFTDILTEYVNVVSPMIIRRESATTVSAKPCFYYRWHGFGGAFFPVYPNPNNKTGEVKAIFVQQYARLIVEDPALPDDRDAANFVMHVASDHKNETGQTVEGATGISKFKKVTKDWQSFNMITGITEQELRSNPPPFSLTP